MVSFGIAPNAHVGAPPLVRCSSGLAEGIPGVHDEAGAGPVDLPTPSGPPAVPVSTEEARQPAAAPEEPGQDRLTDLFCKYWKLVLGWFARLLSATPPAE